MTSEITGEGEYQYDIKQTLNGCSASTVSKWSIVECPTVAPNPESKMICAGESLPTIDAQGTGANFQWYDESNQLIGTTSTLDISALEGYSSMKEMDTKVYRFSVSQDGDDRAGERTYNTNCSDFSCKFPIFYDPTQKIQILTNFLLSLLSIKQMIISKQLRCLYKESDLLFHIKIISRKTVENSTSYEFLKIVRKNFLNDLIF